MSDIVILEMSDMLYHFIEKVKRYDSNMDVMTFIIILIFSSGGFEYEELEEYDVIFDLFNSDIVNDNSIWSEGNIGEYLLEYLIEFTYDFHDKLSDYDFYPEVFDDFQDMCFELEQHMNLIHTFIILNIGEQNV